MFDLREATKGRPLYYLVMHLFEKYKFYDAYQIDYNTVKNFVEKIESGYKVKVNCI